MMASPYDSLIREAANRYGVDPNLVKAFVRQESNFNPRAKRVEAQLSDASYGLMQILYSTARGEGYNGTPEGLLDPVTNLNYGVLYLKRCLTRTDQNAAAAASMYNGGYRPELGFGAGATRNVTVCLMRDAQGKCIKSVDVKQGDFANRAYVDNVMRYYGAYINEAATAPAATEVRAQVGDTTIAFQPAPWLILTGLLGGGWLLFKLLSRRAG